MTSISNNSPLASYVANTPKTTTAATGSSPAEPPRTETTDPLAEIRRFANGMVANSRGGLLRAMNADSSEANNAIASDRFRPVTEQPARDNPRIALPDVADLDRDDAAKLLAQIDKLLDAGLDKSDSFVGYNGEQQTESLTTYRDWLQARGGVSIYV